MSVADPAVHRPADVPTAISASVVICCYTDLRWPQLMEACRSVRGQLRPGDELVVVVDHNDALLGRAGRELAGTRVLPSDGPRGLSAARNTGVRVSAGDIVVFLDDDASARPGWLQHLRRAFAEPDVVVAGTRVEPRWQGGAPPVWFPAEFGWVVGCGYRGLPTERSRIRNPIGASMAIRRSLFDSVGGFCDVVGRIGVLPVGCEETEFCIRATREHPDTRVILEPAAQVDHLVPADRQTLRYFVRRCFYEGRSKRAVARLAGAQAALATERRYVRVVLPTGVLRRLAGAPRRPVRLLQAAAIVIGLSATVAGFATAGQRRAATGHR